MNFLKDIRTATGFMTRLPVTWPENTGMADLARAAWSYPFVGAIVGVLTGVVFWIAMASGLPTMAVIIIAIAFQVLTTGGLHEDGLADVADGIGGGNTIQQKLEIMRDSRIGSYGVLALILFITLKAALLMAPVDISDTVYLWISAMVLSRAVLPMVMVVFNPARGDGLGAGAGKPTPANAGWALLWGGVLSGFLLPWGLAITTIITACLCGFLIAAWAKKQIGGYTGDVLGAVVSMVELTILFVGAMWV